MKQTSTSILLFILVIYTFLENAETLRNNNKSFKAYLHNPNLNNANILLPKYGKKYFKSIRINYVHVTDQLIPNYKTGISNETFLLFKKLIIDQVDLFFKKSMKVFPLSNFPQNLIFSRPNEDKTIWNFNVGKYVQGYDYVFFIFFQNIEADAIASAANWMFVNLSNKYQRPLAGEININLLHNSGLARKTEYEIHEMRRVFYHEIIHALAYSEENFPYFVNEEGQQYSFCLIQPYQYSDNRIEYFLQHPKIKKAVEKFYNCKDPELNKGLPISKIDKSHFHQQLSMEDIMRPVSDSFNERISVFLLTLLEITGWYIVPEKIYYNNIRRDITKNNVKQNYQNNNFNNSTYNQNNSNQGNNLINNSNKSNNNKINSSQPNNDTHYSNHIKNPNKSPNYQQNFMYFLEKKIDLEYVKKQNNVNTQNSSNNIGLQDNNNNNFNNNINQINNNHNNNNLLNPNNNNQNIKNSPNNHNNSNPSSKNLLDLIKNNYMKNKSEQNRIEEKMLYGLNKGCNFVNLYCHDENGNLFEEYCDPEKEANKQRCNFHYEAISHCRLLDKEAGSNCAYWFPLEGGNCKNLKEGKIEGSTFMKYGPQSKCFDVVFDSQDEDGACLEAFCDNTEKAIYVFLDKLKFKSEYVNDKPRLQYFYIQEQRMKVLFPKSFERFCFLENHEKNPDKGFKK